MRGIDIEGMRRRAMFLRYSQPLTGDCRGGLFEDLPFDDRTPQMKTMLDLAWLVYHGEPLVPGNSPTPDCGTEGCLVHLTLDHEEQVMQLAARPSMDMRAIFRRGVIAGVFRSVGNYR